MTAPLLPDTRCAPSASALLSTVFALGNVIGLDQTYCANDARGATQSDLGKFCVYQGALVSQHLGGGALTAPSSPLRSPHPLPCLERRHMVVLHGAGGLPSPLQGRATAPAAADAAVLPRGRLVWPPGPRRPRPHRWTVWLSGPDRVVCPRSRIPSPHSQRHPSCPARRCFIRGVNADTGETEPGWQFGFFYGPVCSMVFLAMYFMGSSVIEMYKARRRDTPLAALPTPLTRSFVFQSLQRIKEAHSTTLSRKVELYRVPVLFMTVYFFVFALLIYYRVVLEVEADDVETGMQDWVRQRLVSEQCALGPLIPVAQVQCLLRQFANGVEDPASGTCGKHPSQVRERPTAADSVPHSHGPFRILSQRVSSTVMYLAILVTSGQGLFAWIAFGTTKKIYIVRAAHGLRLRAGGRPPDPWRRRRRGGWCTWAVARRSRRRRAPHREKRASASWRWGRGSGCT